MREEQASMTVLRINILIVFQVLFYDVIFVGEMSTVSIERFNGIIMFWWKWRYSLFSDKVLPIRPILHVIIDFE